MARGVARSFRTICPSKDGSNFTPDSSERPNSTAYSIAHRLLKPFAVVKNGRPKASYLPGRPPDSHWERLNDTSHNSLALLEDRLRLLGRKAGPVLFQHPPQFERTARASPLS